jgi:hypothetical protein
MRHTRGPSTQAGSWSTRPSGRRYRVFVRIWNLGLLPAIGVHVRAWFVNPGFFGGDPNNPAYQPQLIGGAMVNLTDRTRPGASASSSSITPGISPSTLTGHECLMATVSCPAGPVVGRSGRQPRSACRPAQPHHPGGPANAKDLLFGLGGMVAKGGTLELIHGGPAVKPLLQAVGGRAKTEFGVLGSLGAPTAKSLRLGVPIGGGQQHLLTMFQTRKGWLVADSAKVLAFGLELGIIDKRALMRGRGAPIRHAVDHTPGHREARGRPRRTHRGAHRS